MIMFKPFPGIYFREALYAFYQHVTENQIKEPMGMEFNGRVVVIYPPLDTLNTAWCDRLESPLAQIERSKQ